MYHKIQNAQQKEQKFIPTHSPDAAHGPHLGQSLLSIQTTLMANFTSDFNPASTDGRILAVATLMKDLMEKRLASMVERPWARQLWAMKPSFSSARQIASSPSFQFQLGMFRRWAWREERHGYMVGLQNSEDLQYRLTYRQYKPFLPTCKSNDPNACIQQKQPSK